MSNDTERRRGGRTRVLRPVVYVYDNSDRFIDAVLLNHGTNGICFQSRLPVAPGAKVYILSEETPTESFYLKSGDTFFAKVLWCENRAGTHRVGARFIGNAVYEDEDAPSTGVDVSPDDSDFPNSAA